MKLNGLWIFALGMALGATMTLTAPGAVLAQDDDEDAGVEEYEDDEYEEDQAEDRPARRREPQRAREDRPRERRQPRQRAEPERQPERRQGGGGGSSYIERPFTGQRPFQLDVHAGFTFWGLGFATGARFGIPLLHNGFIPNLNNAVYLNFGLDFYYIRSHRDDCGGGRPGQCDYYGPGFGIPITLHWEFYFSDEWSAFAEIGAQFFAHPAWLDNRGFDWGRQQPGAWFVWTIGGSYHFNENILLTVRVGSPYIAAGLTFQF